MTPDQLSRVEQALNVRLPAAYRYTLLAYPFAGDRDTAGMWLLNDPDAVVKLNEASRRTKTDRRPWPSHLLAIGHDGGECTFLLDLSVDPAPVVIFDLETGRTEPLASTFEAFLGKLHDDLAAIAADEQRMAEAYRNKKWWQFWIRP